MYLYMTPIGCKYEQSIDLGIYLLAPGRKHTQCYIQLRLKGVKSNEIHH